MIDFAVHSILVHKREGRACHILLTRYPQPGDNPFDERGLATSEFALQNEQAGVRQLPGQLCAQFHRLVRRVGYKFQPVFLGAWSILLERPSLKSHKQISNAIFVELPDTPSAKTPGCP